MQFIVSGERIATENFSIGKVYTVTFTNGNYFVNACVGIGPDFIMFQQESPKMLFCLDMESAETVSSIDESGGGAGTMNYNELDNKPSINGVTLIGNMTAADLSILPVPIVGENDNNKILTASYSGGVGSYSWQPAPSSGTTDYTQLTNKPQINSVELDGNKSLEDLGIASAEALAGKQDVITDLNTIRSGAAAGATAVQPATLAGYQTLIDSSHKLSSDLVDDTGNTNKFATAAQLAQIETNKNNILLLEQMNGTKNIVDYRNANTSLFPSSTTGATISRSADEWNINGTTNASGTLLANIYINPDATNIFPVGEYVAQIYPTNDDIRLNIAVDNDIISNGLNPVSFTITAETTRSWARLNLGNNKTFNNFKFKLMVVPKALWDAGFTDYQPYCMTVADITAWILSQS